MKVYVVLKGMEYEDATMVYAVVTSEERAKELEAECDNDRWYYGTYSEHEVDEA